MKIKHKAVGSEAIHAFIKGMDGKQAKAGWFEDAQYPDGKPVAEIASVHEFGVASKNIPPRSFFRTTISGQQANWEKAIGSLAKQVIEGNKTADQSMTILAELARGDVHKTIASLGDHDVNSPVAKRRRSRKDNSFPPPTQSTTVLRDSQTLYNTLKAVVDKK